MPSGNSGAAIRLSKARQEISCERDALIKRANFRANLSKHLNLGDGKDRARAIVLTVALGVPGMTPYVLTLTTWFRQYHESFGTSVATMAMLVVLGMLFIVGSTRRATGKDRPWMWWMGVIWTQATVVAIVVGFFLYFQNLAYYWKYQEMRTYTNVAAAQDSSAFGDGSMFLFTEDTRLDAVRSVGYRSRWTGETFCVAPLVDGTMNQGNSIQFFAVGDGCCTARGGFLCDDAEDFTTRSALRVLEPEDVARPWMQWAVRGAAFPKYMEAVKLQEATYATKAARRPALLVWTKDPIKMRDSFYAHAKSICIQVSLAYFAVVLVCVYLAAWTLIPKQKRESVMRL